MADELTFPGGDEDVEPSASRSEFVLSCGFNPASLIRSFYVRLEDDVVVERGLVVAEVEPTPNTTYLLEVMAASDVKLFQRAVTFSEIVEDGGYRFFDSEEWMHQHEKFLSGVREQA